MIDTHPLIINDRFWDDPRVQSLRAMQRLLLIALAALVDSTPRIEIRLDELIKRLSLPNGYNVLRLEKDLLVLAKNKLVKVVAVGEGFNVDLSLLIGLFATPRSTDPTPFHRQVSFYGNVSAVNLSSKKSSPEPFRLNVEQIRIADSNFPNLLELAQQPRVEILLRESNQYLNPQAAAAVSQKAENRDPSVDPWACDNGPEEDYENCTIETDEDLKEYMKHVISSTPLIPPPEEREG